jgi:ABC-2 type transport system ATP-binding protein
MNNCAIGLNEVKKSYRERAVLRGLTLKVPHGSVFGLLGKNGAGKTTLLKCAVGLLKADQGELCTLGEDPWRLSEAVKERIGFVPQGYRPYPWISAGKLIDFTASFYPRWNVPLVDKLVNDWGVDRGARVGTLSEGELQKLLIILALGHEPELLVFDEPVASLDPASRRDFLKTILDTVSTRKCTVFLSTHITSDLERVADMVGVMKAGQIDFCGGLDDLKDAVKRVRVFGLKDPSAALAIEGVLFRQVTGVEGILTVRGFNEAAKKTLEKAADKVVIEDLNLEEIFLEMNR